MAVVVVVLIIRISLDLALAAMVVAVDTQPKMQPLIPAVVAGVRMFAQLGPSTTVVTAALVLLLFLFQARRHQQLEPQL
jgi:hypothetical protein